MDSLTRLIMFWLTIIACCVSLGLLVVDLYYWMREMAQKSPRLQAMIWRFQQKRERAKQLKRFSREILHARYTNRPEKFDEILKPWGLDDRVAVARIDTQIIMKVVGDPLGIDVILGLELGNLEPPPEGYKPLMTWEEAADQIWKETVKRSKELGLKNGNQRN
jgi:hypothetical protein